MYQYDIRVRNTVYLWGSDQMTNSNAHGVLHLHNDVRGDTVTLSQCADGGADVKIGPLAPGQSFTIDLLNGKYVKATCDPDRNSTVTCCVFVP